MGGGGAGGEASTKFLSFAPTRPLGTFMGKKTQEEGTNRRKLHNYIQQFKIWVCLLSLKKTILKIVFQKPNARLSIFTVYRTKKSAWNNPCICRSRGSNFIGKMRMQIHEQK